MIIKRGSRLKGQLRRKAGAIAPLQRGENLQKRSYLCTAATAGTVLVYQLRSIQ